jgi:hypothetical protein
MQEVIRKLEGKAALIVAEKSGMLAEGAAINFLVLDGKIEYEYKKANALERGLNVSSRLWQMGIASD